MKFNQLHYWALTCFALWVLLNYNQPSFGFYPMETAEEVGYNLGHLILPIIGLVLILVASRKKKEKKPEEAK